MKERTPSVTAGTVAAHRAVESERPADERICFDPLARKFLPPGMTVIGKSWLPEKAALWIYEGGLPGFHTYFAIRTRCMDDHLASCIERGLDQLVVLGAGYDSRAYRFERLRERTRVFEVDHRATREMKINRVRQTLGTLPTHVSWVGIEFGRESLAERLRENGFEFQRKTLFIWEGVTYYLTADAVDATLSFIAEAAPGSSVIFDYTHPSVISGTSGRREARAWRRAVKDFGEPLVFGIDEGPVEGFLAQRGFHKEVNATSEVLRAKYLGGKRAERRLSPIFGIASALVGCR